MRLADYMADKDSVWQELVESRALEPRALSSIVLWAYADYLFKPEWDIISDVSKARRDGFAERADSGDMFLEMFDRFRAEKIIP